MVICGFRDYLAIASYLNERPRPQYIKHDKVADTISIHYIHALFSLFDYSEGL